MWRILFLLWAVAGNVEENPARDQLIIFKEKTKKPIATLTTTYGAPIDQVDAKITLNRRLACNDFFLESFGHFIRERIPERVVHAKGAGAFGYFEVTNDISSICKADLFSKVGKRTPIAVRFSTVAIERGGSDTVRETRGYAVKFYTEEGNFDIVGLNTPMFSFTDPIYFPAFAKAQKRNPATNLFDGNMLWDFITLHPESLFKFLLVFSDRGIPKDYRHMPGFGIHTYEVVNKKGDQFFVRFHFLPEAGVENLSSQEARRIASVDPDHATRDLYNTIGRGRYPAWRLSIQLLTLNDVKNAPFDIFDPTRVLPLDKYPLRPVGRLVLNKNPINFHAEIEQLAFSPGNLVPGVLGSPDKMFEARRLSYRDAQYHRLGVNFNKIPVNCPLQTAAYTYNRDGVPPVEDNGRDSPNYFPNSFNGPVEYIEKNRVELVEIYQYPPNNFDQMTELYVNEFDKEERSRLVENILYSIGPVAKFIQERAVKLFKRIHPDLGYRVEQGLLANRTVIFASYNV